MVEYGGGISKGPAGQVGGVGGTPQIGGGGDLFAPIGNAFDNGVAWIGSLSTIELVALAAVVFVGLLILRRVF